MELFLDSALVDEIERAWSFGVISGVTTNPSLLAQSGGKTVDVLRRICEIVDGPVSAECVSESTDEIIDEAERLADLAPADKRNIVVKVPMTISGIAAVSQLSKRGIRTNVTLVFSPNQGILAGIAGASYISPFVGRLDDIGHDGMDLIRDLASILDTAQYGKNATSGPRIIAASIRHPLHVLEAVRAGAHIATVPFKVLTAMYNHPLTAKGVEQFLVDWEQLTGSRGPIV